MDALTATGASASAEAGSHSGALGGTRRRRRRWPTPGAAALRSALVPGWGQWAAGRRRRGLVLVGLTLLFGLVLMLTVVATVRAFLPMPSWLSSLAALVGDLPLKLLDRLLATEWTVVWRGLIIANLVLAAIRIWIAVDAAGCARPLHVSGGAFAALAALVVLVAPHVGLFGIGIAVRPLIDRVLVTAAPAPPTSTQASTAGALPEPDPGRPIWNGDSRLNVLLMGVDRRPQETEIRPRGNSDTLLVVSIDPNSQTAAMVSIPRDLYLTIPGVGPEKINAAYREVGPDLSVRVVSDLIGQPLHRWASIDISAFGRMIDALGGVVVDVERPIRDDEFPNEDYSIRRIYLPSGLQWLTGEQALWYARSRHGSNDFDRAQRQQALLLSLKDRARDRRTLAVAGTLINSLADAVQTDISPREALALVRMGGTTDFRSARLVLTPPVYGREVIRPNLYAIEPNVPRIRAAVAETLSPSAGPASRQGPDTFGTVPAQGGSGPIDDEPDDMSGEEDIP